MPQYEYESNEDTFIKMTNSPLPHHVIARYIKKLELRCQSIVNSHIDPAEIAKRGREGQKSGKFHNKHGRAESRFLAWS
eukprot:COSAG01_NODE_6846_length_3471_cov_17.654804_3_plen_79_part_00